MPTATVAIDLAQDVFASAFADIHGRIIARKRLLRPAFTRCLAKRPLLRVVMEACGEMSEDTHHSGNPYVRTGIYSARPCARRA